MKVRTVTVTSPQLVHVNNCDLVVVVTNDSETSTREEESSEPENCDVKTSYVWCKTDKKNQAMILSLEPQV